MYKIIMQMKAHHKQTGIDYEIHAPYKIGIGMKPEEITALKEAIDKRFLDSSINLVYYI